MNILYTGPSWANRSYDRDDEYPITNLYKELSLNVIDITTAGSNNIEMLHKTQRYINKTSIDKIIWVLSEPISQLSNSKSIEMLQNKNYQIVRKQLINSLLFQLNKLNIPVGIIGAHSGIGDIDTIKYNNISIIHNSWQQFLCDYASVINLADWGADPLHVTLINNPNITPDNKVVTDIFNCFLTWENLEKHNLFYQVHPNFNGTKLFAKHIREDLFLWLDNE